MVDVYLTYHENNNRHQQSIGLLVSLNRKLVINILTARHHSLLCRVRDAVEKAEVDVRIRKGKLVVESGLNRSNGLL